MRHWGYGQSSVYLRITIPERGMSAGPIVCSDLMLQSMTATTQSA